MSYDTPIEFRPGLLERKSDFGDLLGVPILRNMIPVLPEKDWGDALTATFAPNYRPYVWNVYDQDGIGSCASESCDGMIMNFREATGRPRVLFNPWPAYADVSGRVDRGSSLDENIEYRRSKGSFPDALWPRAQHGWSSRPPESVYQEALKYRIDEAWDIDNTSRVQYQREFVSALASVDCSGVYFGIPGHAIYAVRATHSSKATQEQLSAANDADQRIKAYLRSIGLPVQETGLKSADDVLIDYLNSWKDTWGDKGFGTVRLSQAVPSYGAFVLRSLKGTD